MNTRKHYHLIGIGGIGMSGIAQLLLRRGMRVSGSDIKESPTLLKLKEMGVTTFIGHREDNIQGAHVIVYSSAIKESNPEIKEAKKRNLSLLKRAEALADLMEEKKVITVAGSHGKTTTSSLAAYLLIEAGLHPTIAVGGILKNIGANASFGEGDFFVAEADESDGSFLHYKPTYSIITNIDREHLDYYKTFEHELEAFESFIRRTHPEGSLFCCGDDPYLKELLKKGHTGRIVLFGMDTHCDYYPKDIVISELSSEFDCMYRDKLVGRFQLSLGGRHNISNALSVIALGVELGITFEIMKKALRLYQGAGRRLEMKYRDQDYILLDDYAHHPTEIRATLQAVEALPHKRIIALFQPHRYSRTQLLFDAFVDCFKAADVVMLTDIYAASEAAIEGVNARVLAEAIKKNNPRKEVLYLPKEVIAASIIETTKPGDVIVTLGAGDITKVSDELAKIFSRKH